MHDIQSQSIDVTTDVTTADVTAAIAPLRPTVRLASDDDAPAIAALVNSAFRVERWFTDSDRTDPGQIRALQRDGAFLVLERQSGSLAASIYVRVQRGCGSFTLLAVAPELQRAGLGRRLIAVAEALCAAEGCAAMELEVNNLRAELPPWYRSLGYRECGTAPLDQSQAKLPCHAIRMSKPLA